MNLLLMLSLLSQVDRFQGIPDAALDKKGNGWDRFPVGDDPKQPGIGLDAELPPPEVKVPKHVKDVKKWWAYEKRMAVRQMTKDARKQYVLELRRAHAMYKRAGRKWRIAAGIPAMKHQLARTSVDREVGRFWLQASLHKRGRAPSPWKVPLYKIGK